MEDLTVILTASIDVKGMIFTERSDPHEREQDYINALSQWIKTGLPIIFCENSGYDLSKIHEMTSSYNKIEILQFDGQKFDKSLGKGFGEQEILHFIAENSILFSLSKKIIKITGRYYLKNIKQFEGSLAIVNGVSTILKKNLTFSDSRVIISTPEFITDYLFLYTSRINDKNGYYFEHALSQAIHKYMADSGEWIMLPHYPIISGYSGTSNAKINSIVKDFKRKIFYSLKLWFCK
jgi:hypothetical protein